MPPRQAICDRRHHAREIRAIPRERLDLLKLPKAIRDPINGLVRAFNAASTREGIESEGAMQIALILALENAMRGAEDGLHIDAVHRLGRLSGRR